MRLLRPENRLSHQFGMMGFLYFRPQSTPRSLWWWSGVEKARQTSLLLDVVSDSCAALLLHEYWNCLRFRVHPNVKVGIFLFVLLSFLHFLFFFFFLSNYCFKVFLLNYPVMVCCYSTNQVLSTSDAVEIRSVDLWPWNGWWKKLNGSPILPSTLKNWNNLFMIWLGVWTGS